ncbi:MAG: SOS response-associated peptidase [Anaerolineales bacterium]|nr:SOS response-associated peptidase [Anaerolineales bacterium]
MCGRYSLTASPEELIKAFPWVTFPKKFVELFSPQYNVAPSHPVAAITNEDTKQLTFLLWGLIPSWTRNLSEARSFINARAESAHEKASFKNPLKRRRCLILADGFFEWGQGEEKSQKTPFYFTMADKTPFAFAGLWEIWKSPDGDEIRTCTILTTEPNELVSPIHNRMPVIVNPNYFSFWLTRGEQIGETYASIFQPYPAELMSFYPVSTAVNNPQNNSIECILSVSARD